MAPWNAVLTSLEYFITRFKGYDVGFLLPISFMICKIFAAGYVIYYGTLENLNKRFMISITLCAIFMIGMAVLPAILSTSLGFYLCLLLASFLGTSNAIYNSSCNGYVAMFPAKY